MTQTLATPGANTVGVHPALPRLWAHTGIEPLGFTIVTSRLADICVDVMVSTNRVGFEATVGAVGGR